MLQAFTLTLLLTLLQGCAALFMTKAIGIAENWKLGAVIRTHQNDIFFVEDLNHWGNDTGKKIEVRGRLIEIEHKKTIQDEGSIAASANHSDWVQKVIKKARWRILKQTKPPQKFCGGLSLSSF